MKQEDYDAIEEGLQEESFEEPKKKEPEIDEEQVNKDEEKDYLMKALEESDPQMLSYVKYNAIGLKIKEGKPITEEEKAFVEDMNKLYALEKKSIEEETIRQQEEEALKQKVLEEYNIVKNADPSKIDTLKQKDEKYRGGESLPKLLKFAMAMKKVKKKGGKVLVKITRDRQFFIEWTNKDIQFVEFWKKDEKGNLIPEITRFQEYKYTYEGSPVPVLFAVQGYSNGYDFFDKYRKDITSEMVSRIASRAYHSGYLEGINLSDKKKKDNMLAALTEFMPLILIGGLLILGWLMYQMYTDMGTMYNAVQVMQAQMNTLAPVVDANAIILR